MELISDDLDYSAYMHEPEAKTKVRSAADFIEAMKDRMTKPDFARGIELPWKKTRDNFRIRPHELTLWPGINGHGKSLVISQIMIASVSQGAKVLIASMEMTPAATMERIYRQSFRGADYHEELALDLESWARGKVWIYDHVGSVEWRKLLGIMRYCHVELGINQFVIDSLMRCGIKDDDYSGQKDFIDALCTFRNDYPVHVHLVLHSKKLQDENQAPGKFDAKGSGTMTDLADNVVTVWRNKKKEDAITKPSHERSHAEEMAVNGPDSLLIVDKQRHHEWEGKIMLWYIRGAMQFVQSENDQPMELMEYGA